MNDPRQYITAAVLLGLSVVGLLKQQTESARKKEAVKRDFEKVVDNTKDQYCRIASKYDELEGAYEDQMDDYEVKKQELTEIAKAAIEEQQKVAELRTGVAHLAAEGAQLQSNVKLDLIKVSDELASIPVEQVRSRRDNFRVMYRILREAENMQRKRELIFEILASGDHEAIRRFVSVDNNLFTIREINGDTALHKAVYSRNTYPADVFGDTSRSMQPERTSPRPGEVGQSVP